MCAVHATVQEQANLEEIARYFAGFELMGNPVTMVKEVSARPWRGLRVLTSCISEWPNLKMEKPT